MMWGRSKENGIWFGGSRWWMLRIWRGDTILYASLGRLKVRIMKPRRSRG